MFDSPCQVNRTLNTKEDNQKVKGQALVALKDLVNMAELCEKILEVRTKSLLHGHFACLKGYVNSLYGYPEQSITVNQARFYTAHTGNATLKDELIDETLDIIVFWPALTDQVDEMGGLTFDRHAPKMRAIMPSIEDEDLLKLEPEECPRVPAEKVEWLIAKAYDVDTKNFGKNYIDWFCCESLYVLMYQNHAFVVQYFNAYLRRRDEEYVNGPTRPITEAATECDMVTDLQLGYLGAMEPRPFSEKSYSAFHRCFVDKCGEYGIKFRLVAQGARRNKVFEARELKAIQFADTEPKFYENFALVERMVTDGSFPIDKLDGLCAFIKDTHTKIRDDAHEFLAGVFIKLAEVHIKEIRDEDNDGNKLQKTSSLKDMLAMVPSLTNVDLSSRLSALKSKASADADKLQSVSSRQRLLAMMESEEVDKKVHAVSAAKVRLGNSFICRPRALFIKSPQAWRRDGRSPL